MANNENNDGGRDNNQVWGGHCDHREDRQSEIRTYHTDRFPHEPHPTPDSLVLGAVACTPDPDKVLHTKKYDQKYFLRLSDWWLGGAKNIFTIQNRAKSAVSEYSVIVERTLNIRQVRTERKLR